MRNAIITESCSCDNYIFNRQTNYSEHYYLQYSCPDVILAARLLNISHVNNTMINDRSHLPLNCINSTISNCCK